MYRRECILICPEETHGVDQRGSSLVRVSGDRGEHQFLGFVLMVAFSTLRRVRAGPCRVATPVVQAGATRPTMF